jgi:hypothetical protein
MTYKSIQNIITLFKSNFPFMFRNIIKPKEPEINQCCGCNCKNCIWIVYYKKLEEFEKKYNK